MCICWVAAWHWRETHLFLWREHHRFRYNVESAFKSFLMLAPDDVTKSLTRDNH